MGWIVAVDIGGTFTDVVAVSDQGRLMRHKTLSTPEQPELGVRRGIDHLRSLLPELPEAVRIIHGTTLVSNALISRGGGTTGLLTTKGFRDLLTTGTEGRYSLFDPFAPMPTPLVRRRLRHEATERVAADGTVVTELDEQDVERAIEAWRAEGVRSAAIFFVNSYANPANELRARELMERSGAFDAISVSSEISRRLREVPRLSTAVADAYVKPLVVRYLNRLDEWLDGDGYTAKRYMMQSEGGLTSFEDARGFPIRIVESGPVGAVALTAEIARVRGDETAISFDMGGTTAKVCAVRGAELPISEELEVARERRFEKGSGLPLSIPSIDMVEIGAGGGSIVSVGSTGLIEIGPKSAGADPGPACYGLGGHSPTVTDAVLVLGYLPDALAGGTFTLDRDAARDALLTLDVRLDESEHGEHVAAAHAVFELVSHSMAAAIVQHGLDRGLDITRACLIATGGSAPSHAWRVAEIAGIDTILVPNEPGVGSALGMSMAPVGSSIIRSAPLDCTEDNLDEIRRLVQALRADAYEAWATSSGVPDPPSLSFFVTARYLGQWHELEIELPKGPVDAAWLTELRTRFEARFGRVLRRASLDYGVELLDWRVTATESQHRPVTPGRVEGEPVQDGSPRSREAFLGTGLHTTPVVARGTITRHWADGPLLVDEATTTTVVPPQWRVRESAGLLELRRAPTHAQ